MKNRPTIRTKIMLAVCAIVVADFVLCIGIYYYFFAKHTTEGAQIYLDTVVASIQDNLIQFEKDINQIATMPYYSNMISIINKHAEQSELFISKDDISQISNHLLYMKSMKNHISNAYIPMINGKLFTIQYMNVAKNWTFSDMPWLADCARDGSLTMLPYHEATYVEGEARYVVSFVRTLKNIDTMDNIAYLVIDIDSDKFNYCIPQEAAYGEQFYIFTDQGELVYPYRIDNDDEYFYIADSAINDSRYLQSKAEIPNLHLKVVGILNTKNYSSNMQSLLKVLLIACAVILAFSVVMLLFITKSISKPIRQLRQAMLGLVADNFKTQIHLKTGDEIEILADGFNKMVDEIQRLLVQIEESNQKERRILFKLLQGQMSPHFIYNSLETLSSMAMLSENYKLAEGIVCLSRLMRHLTDNAEQQDTLIEELNFVEDYIYIQNLTTGLHIDFVQDVDFVQEYLLVPKFILQPLIENAYRHAGKNSKITLLIKSSIVDNHLLLTVRNDGKGISQERIQQIMARINNESVDETTRKQKHGFALRNIHQRIRLLYGEEYGLSIGNATDNGFEIILDLPVIWDEEYEDSDS